MPLPDALADRLLAHIGLDDRPAPDAAGLRAELEEAPLAQHPKLELLE